MKCNCKSEMEKSLQENTDYHGKKILRAEIDAMLVFGNPMQLYTSSAVTLTLDGRKSKVDVQIKHTYCPWCGMKADNKIEDETEKKLNPVTG